FLPPSSLSFFFYSSGDRLDLHSFPTRRSSDLWRGGSSRERPDLRLHCGHYHYGASECRRSTTAAFGHCLESRVGEGAQAGLGAQDRKSTRLNSSHVKISYAVFCLKKKNKTREM